MKISIGCMSVLLAALVGCGGVDDSKKLSELSTDESKDVCDELADDYPEKTVTCDGVMFTIKVNCDGQVASPNCTATVGDARDCSAALYVQAEACMIDAPLPPACAKLAGC